MIELLFLMCEGGGVGNDSDGGSGGSADDSDSNSGVGGDGGGNEGGMAGGGGMAGANDSSMGGSGTAAEGASNAGESTGGSGTEGTRGGGFGPGGLGNTDTNTADVSGDVSGVDTSQSGAGGVDNSFDGGHDNMSGLGDGSENAVDIGAPLGLADDVETKSEQYMTAEEITKTKTKLSAAITSMKASALSLDPVAFGLDAINALGLKSQLNSQPTNSFDGGHGGVSGLGPSGSDDDGGGEGGGADRTTANKIFPAVAPTTAAPEVAPQTSILDQDVQDFVDSFTGEGRESTILTGRLPQANVNKRKLRGIY